MSAAVVTAPTRGLRLYELPAAFAAIDLALEDLGGELTPELEAELDRLEGTLEDKTDAICAMVRERTARGEVLAAEGKRFAERAQVERNAADRLKDYLLRTLQSLGRDRVEGQRFKARIQRNGMPSIRWAGSGEIPEPFRQVTVSLDYDMARAAWKADQLPQGFEASVGSHLRIQ